MGLKKIKTFLEKAYPLYVATSDTKGNPHVITVGAFKIIDDKKLLIIDNYMKSTKKNIISNPKIEILVYGENWKGYRIKGSVKYQTSGKWVDMGKEMMKGKHPAKGALLITAKKIDKIGK